jgi:uncharacterized protein
MFGRFKLSGWLVCLLLLEAVSFVGAAIVVTTPAQAQFWGGRPGGGGFFGGWFGGGGGGGGGGGYYQRPPQRGYREYREYESSPAESAHAPPPRKVEVKPDQMMPTTNVVVMGDGMSDWLAYGLEDAFADTPEVSILRKNKTFSGLIKYDPKSDLDWWHVARDILAPEKPSYVVMMIGVSDRQNIRERDLQKEAEKEQKEKEAKEAKEKEAKEQKAKEQGKEPARDAARDQKDASKEKDAKEQKAQPVEQEQKSAEENVDAEAPPAEQQKQTEKPKRPANGIVEFRSEQWEKIYNKRIDETIAALKSKNVPVFWVGLPAIRGTKSTADTSYLNNLYRARAQKAGIIFIDVWDGFVDEEGKYTSYGPDYEGQQRRLRSNDGVYFTKYGARKLAHYVEREIRRYMASRTVSLPSPTAAPTPGSGKPTERPVAGPVIPLALTPSDTDDQLAGRSSRPQGDPLALQVLVKGEPVNPQPGRADDFTWQGAQRPAGTAPPNVKAAPAPAAAAPASAPAPQSEAHPVTPQPSASVQPAAPGEANSEPVSLTDQPAEQPAPAKPKPQRAEAKPKPAPAHSAAPRPPRDGLQQRSGTSGGLFGIFR